MTPTIPSEEEYITSRIAEARKMAVEYASKRTKGSPLPERLIDHDIINLYKSFIDDADKNIKLYEREINNIISKYEGKDIPWADKNINNLLPIFKSKIELKTRPRELSKKDKDRIDYLNEKIHLEKIDKEIYSNFVNTKGLYRNNCITSASCNYKDIGYLKGLSEPVVSNMELRKNPTKYGFKEVDNAEPGDIQNTPYHAVTIHNKHLVSYAPGRSDEIKYIHSNFNPLDYDKELKKNFRFIGTPQDSLAWKKEYVDKYINKK